MKTVYALLAACAALASYYVYTPLPDTISDPWKLMFLDATFRGAQDLSNMAHYFGLGHHLRVLYFISTYFDKQDAASTDKLTVTDTVFDGVQVRIFEPVKRVGVLKRGIVYIHGGGWALGGARLRSYDHLCRKVAEDVDAVVVSIEYRLVPDVHFPEQLNDAHQATTHFLRPDVLAEYSVDPNRIAISGDSAGGNLAAVLCQQFARDSSVVHKFKLQALIYPVLQVLDFNTPSYQSNKDMPVNPRFVMAKFWLDYFNGDHSFVHAMLVNNHTSMDHAQAETLRARLNWNSLLPAQVKKHYQPVMQSMGTPHILQKIPALLDVRASPLAAAKETLQLLPKTYVLTCEYDVLRDDGIMYVKRLEEAGVEVEHDHYDDGFHGCMIFATWPTYFCVGIRTRDNYIKWLDENL
ncbi:neutral cholesterol ester hydrolase 1 [Ambystoma mexicanum]|uniref:neutral cholesterol ester hydrolase 1 n=1 Tax=Ambystoma mexicanum TaxID=8296 RepID=UPI0037E974F8